MCLFESIVQKLFFGFALIYLNFYLHELYKANLLLQFLFNSKTNKNKIIIKFFFLNYTDVVKRKKNVSKIIRIRIRNSFMLKKV